MRLMNRSTLSEPELRNLEAEVLGHTSLVEAMEYSRRQGNAAAFPLVVIQDEYSHDVVFPWRGGRFLAYGTT